MTPAEKLITVRKEETAMDTLFKFSKYNVGRFPVLEQDGLGGAITRSDLMHAKKLRIQAS